MSTASMNPANPLGLIALRSVSLHCTSVADALAFYETGWGLEVVHSDDSSAYLRGTGPEHHILDLHLNGKRGLRHVAFAVATPQAVDAAAARLQSDGIALEHEPKHNEGVGGGYSFGFRDPEGRLVVISSSLDSVAPRDVAAPVPTELSHVVLNTADFEATTEFWTSVVGLRISDWSEDQMVFLRCNSQHHSIAFNRAEWTSVNHIAYNLPSIDAFMKSIGRLRHAGHAPLWGPGRHGPGDNAFAYYGDPVGYVPEITTGLSVVDESKWVPRVWQRVAEQSDLWGTAGPPSAEARERMAGEPDPSWPNPSTKNGGQK